MEQGIKGLPRPPFGPGFMLDGESVVSAGVYIPGRIKGLWYNAPFAAYGSAGAITLSKLFATPYVVGEPQTFDRLGTAILAVASSFLRFGVYSDNAGRPDRLLYDTGQVSAASAGECYGTLPPLMLSGLVWLAAVGQGVAPKPIRLAAHASWYCGISNLYSQGWCTAYSLSSITAELPHRWGTTWNQEITANTIPMLYMRKA